MKIYRLKSDFDNFKFPTFTDNDNSAKRASNFLGQSLKEDWQPLRVNIFHGKTKSEQSRSENFKISCFFSRIPFANKDLAILISSKLFKNECIEILPVESDAGEFYFINIVGTVDAINTEGVDFEEKMHMIRSNNFKFKNGCAAERSLFRDSTFKEYFITKPLAFDLEKFGIEGAKLLYVGDA